MDSITTDGRHLRGERTRSGIIDACRALMKAGNFRPTVVEIAAGADFSVRSVFEHYGDVETVHWAALDAATADAIAGLVVAAHFPTAECIAHAAVFGRPIPAKA